jgi:ABC-type amino acid transport substrate-binding protein
MTPETVKYSNGKWVGISLRLWQWVAQDVGLTCKYEEHDLQGILDDVSRGALDAAVGALTITVERERFDFSHSFSALGWVWRSKRCRSQDLLPLSGTS